MFEVIFREKIEELYLEYISRYKDEDFLLLSTTVDNLKHLSSIGYITVMLLSRNLEISGKDLIEKSEKIFPLKIDFNMLPLKSAKYSTVALYGERFFFNKGEIEIGFLQEITRLLKDNGKFIFLYPNNGGVELWKISSKIRRYLPYIAIYFITPWWGYLTAPVNLRNSVIYLNNSQFDLINESKAYIFICSKKYFKVNGGFNLYAFPFVELDSPLVNIARELEQTKKVYEDKVASIEREKSILREEIQNLKEELVNKAKELSELQLKNLEFRAEIERYKQREKILTLKEEQIKQQQQLINSLSGDKEKLELLLEEKNHDLRLMESNLKRISTRMLQIEQIYYNQQKELTESRLRLHQLEKEVAIFKERIGFLQEEVIQYKFEAFKLRIRELKESLYYYKDKLREAQEVIIRLESRISDFTQETKQLYMLLKDKENLLMEMNRKLEEKEKKYEMMIEQLKAKERDYQAEIEVLKMKLEQQEGKIWNLEEEVTRTKARLFASLKQAELKEVEVDKKMEEIKRKLKDKERIVSTWSVELSQLLAELEKVVLIFVNIVSIMELVCNLIKVKR